MKMKKDFRGIQVTTESVFWLSDITDPGWHQLPLRKVVPPGSSWKEGQRKLQGWEACAPQQRAAPFTSARESPSTATKPSIAVRKERREAS